MRLSQCMVMVMYVLLYTTNIKTPNVFPQPNDFTMDFTGGTGPDTPQDETLDNLEGQLDKYMSNIAASPHAADAPAPALPAAPIASAPPPAPNPNVVEAEEERSRLQFSTQLHQEISTYDFNTFALGGMAIERDHPRDLHTSAIHPPHISIFLDQIKASVDARVRNLIYPPHYCRDFLS